MHGDGDPVSYGCALGFIYYLTVQLGFTINEVIANYSGNLASCYHAVTGDPADPFPGFTGILGHVFPPAQTGDADRHQSRQSVPDRAGAVLRAEEHLRQGRGPGHHQPPWRADLAGVLGRDRRPEQAGLPEPRACRSAPFTGAFTQLSRGDDHRPTRSAPEFQNGVHAKSPQRIRIPFDITLSHAAFIGQFPATGVSAPARPVHHA